AQGALLKSKLAWLDGPGHVDMLPARGSLYNFPLRFSPDGTSLALSAAEEGNRDVWVYQWQRNTRTRLTSAPGPDGYPVWSPDGAHIAFYSASGPLKAAILWKRSDGTGETVQLAVNNNPIYPFSFSPKGDYLAFNEQNPRTKGDIWLLPVEDAHGDHPKPG